MYTILVILQVFLSLALIALVLLQHGKGADAGAAFGSGASQTVFGSRGSSSFLTRATAILATLFFLTSMGLAYYATKVAEPVGVMDRIDGESPLPGSLRDMPPIAPTPAGSDVPSPVPPPAAPATPDPTGAMDVPGDPTDVPGDLMTPAPDVDVPVLFDGAAVEPSDAPDGEVPDESADTIDRRE